MEAGLKDDKQAETQRRKGAKTQGGNEISASLRILVDRHLSALIAILIFITTLVVYIVTLAPSVVTLFDDSLEFQLVTYQLGIAHPTGYPLYTMLGKLFTLLPVGNVAYRVNLMSAVFGSASVALVYLLIRQIIISLPNFPPLWSPKTTSFSLRPPTWAVHIGAITGALLFASGPVFWQQATIAEVYTLNTFFVAVILLIAILPVSPHRAHRRFYWLAFLTGLSLTHHRTTVLLIPALAVYLYLNRQMYRFTWKTLMTGGLVGVAPLLLYLYLPLRGHIGSLDGTYQNTVAGFFRQIGSGGYGTFIFDNPFGHERNAIFYWDLMRSQFYTLTLGFVGIFYLLWIRQRRILAVTGVAFFTYLGFNLIYQVTDIEVFFIPNFLIWAVWSGIGATFLLHIISTMKPVVVRVVLAAFILVIFGFAVFQNIQTTRPLLAERNTWQVHDYGVDMLQQPLEESAAIVGIVGEMTLIRYFQQTEGWRPDIQTLSADRETERIAAVEKLLNQGKSVYLTRELPDAAERWSLGAVGPLIRVSPNLITELPVEASPLNQPVTPAITLAGYQVTRPPHTGAGLAPVRLTLYWQVESPPESNLKVSARLLNPAGEVVVAQDAVPVHFAYPTTAWRSGEIVPDVYDLALPADTPPGPYTPLLIWYDPAQNAAEVGRVELSPIIID